MIVVMVKIAILVSRPLTRISFKITKKCQGSFILDLHQDLVDRAISGVKLVNLLVGGFEHLSSRWSPILAIFHPLSYCASSYLSLFLGFSSWASSASSAFMYLIAL